MSKMLDRQTSLNAIRASDGDPRNSYGVSIRSLTTYLSAISVYLLPIANTALSSQAEFQMSIVAPILNDLVQSSQNA